MMPALRETARITGVKTEVRTDLNRPADNYRTAARIVWLACLRDAETNGERYDDGWLRKGTLSHILGLLWPTLTRNEQRSALNQISQYLRESGNAVLMDRAYGSKPSTWYIRGEWTEAGMNGKTAKAAAKKTVATRPTSKAPPGKTSRKTLAKSLASAVPIPTEVAPESPVNMEDVTNKDFVIASLVEDNNRLRKSLEMMRGHLAWLLSVTD